MADPPTNDWQRAYDESIARETAEADRYELDHPFLTFPIRGILFAAGLGSLAVALVARAVQFGEGWVSWLFWLIYLVLVAVGTVLWWRNRQKKIRS